MDRTQAAILAILDRSTGELNPLANILGVLDSSPRPSETGGKALAIGFDANALFSIARHSRTDKIVDLLSVSPVPLVLPGQVLQEFWNNKLNGIETLSKRVASQLQALETGVQSIETDMGIDSEIQTLRKSLDAFTAKHGELTSARLTTALKSLFEMLQARTSPTYFPRSPLLPVANARLLTKTPPGFKDTPWLGDSFVWADFLLGATRELGRRQKAKGDYVILVSEDRKPDWEVSARPHPLLSAEAGAVLKCDLDVFSVPELLEFLESSR